MAENLDGLIAYYRSLFQKHGATPGALGWDKGKQFLRFHQLTSEWDLNGSSILDVGCGFGDFIGYLDRCGVREYAYTGIDVVEEFIEEARRRHCREGITFILADFLQTELQGNYDYMIASGTFNLKIDGVDGYDLIRKNIGKMFDCCTRALSVDFISDKVDYRHVHNFNSNPETILGMAYELSRNVVLKNTYFPFEFCVTIYKDDTFSKATTVFSDVEKRLGWLA